MHTSGSFIKGTAERIRMLLREPDANTSYTNTFLTRTVVMSAYTEALALMNMVSERKIVNRVTLALKDGTEYYVLPPCMGQILRIAELDAEKRVKSEWTPKSEYHPDGPTWRIEGNVLAWRPVPLEDDSDYEIWYVHNGDMQMHVGKGSLISETVVELDPTPQVGMLDQRENAYVGSFVRLIQSGFPWQERIIESYDALTRQATLRVKFDDSAGMLPAFEPSISTSLSSPGTVDYEVSPAGFEPLSKVIACCAALEIGVGLNITEKKMRSLEFQRDTALKALVDTYANAQTRTAKNVETMTVDNRGHGEGWFGLYQWF